MFLSYNIIQTADSLTSNNGYWYTLVSAVMVRFNRLQSVVLQEFGPHGMLVLGLFALFLVLIIIIYIKSLIDTFKAGSVEQENFDGEPEGLYYTIDEEPSYSANDNESTAPLYDEEEKERIEQERNLSAELVRLSQEAATSNYSDAVVKQKMKNDAQKKQDRIKKSSRKSTQTTTSDLPTGKVENLVALILTLLSRGVSEAKTIQALYFYYHDTFKEEDVFQLVRSVRDFIGLYNTGRFETLPNRAELPSPKEALLEFGKGNAAKCLVLLQALLNDQMELADREGGNVQDLNYAIAANYACLMGNIARLNDIDLAHNSFELATELSPQSVRAWNRLGDMYMLENSPEKALIAFQNVLDIGDPMIYAPQIADAQQYLATYFSKSGLEEKAEEMRNQSHRFYEIYGMYTPLSSAERNVFQTLLNHSEDNLEASISALLSNTR